ncbi:MAG: hypothetical protein ABR500_15450 [Dermatophilaceae bacterium]|nr:hypothetical protein [Intrasporangiaceae bacterium]
MTTTGTPPSGSYGSVAEEIAALAEALRARSRGGDGGPAGASGTGGDHGDDHGHGDTNDHDRDHDRHSGTGIDACEICPVCRAIAALHTVSPAAVTSLADLAHQAEVTLRALASDLRMREEGTSAPAREDIPVDDLGDDVGDE